MEKSISSPAKGEYRAFPNIESRNSRQENMEIPMVVKFMDVRQGLRILEVGCGRGIALPPLFELCQPKRLAGIDVDETLVEKARQRVQGLAIDAEIIHGDVRDMPFPDNAFDLVIDFGTCYHIARPEAALKEISRVLDVNGEFIYETPINQFFSHPVRSYGRRIPWNVCPEFKTVRRRLLWNKSTKLL